MTESVTERVVMQPVAGRRIQQGIHKIVAAVRPTLGPRPRLVAVQRSNITETPELLDDAGLIVRRIIALPDRDEDMGAMLARQAVWRVHDRAGDGAATAAVLLESVYDQGLAYIAAGGNAKRLQTRLEQGMRLILAELARMTVPISGQEKLTQFAYAICQDQEMARLSGEIFDIIGEWGQLEVRAGSGRELEREYVEGMFWDGTPFSREMLTAQGLLRVDLEDAAILISNLSIEDPHEIVPLLSLVKEAGIRSLFITAQDLSSAVIALLLANSGPEKLQIMAVKTSLNRTPRQQGLMEDLALLTGGRLIAEAAGEKLSGVQLADLGRARKAWADREYFGIIGGRGDPRALRGHLSQLRAAFGQMVDPDARQEMRARIGKLLSGSATLWIGGATETEVNVRKELAQRTAEAMRGAMLEGVLPGGGAALLMCRSALHQRLAGSSDPDERAACRILIRALEEPARTIIGNAGCDVAGVLAAINRAGAGCGFEVHAERVVNMAEAGVLDAASVTRTAVATAITMAGLALTTDVLIHRRKPEEALTP